MFKRSFITILLTIGLVFLLSLISEYSQRNAISELQQRTHADLNRYILTMRQKLARFRDIPQLLSKHPDLVRMLRVQANSNDLLRANRLLSEINRILGTRDSYLMNGDGLTVASSNWASQRSFIGGNFNYRPYFKIAIAGGLGQYFALGTTSKRRGFFYSYPVRHKERILGVIVVKIDLNEIERDWNEKDIKLLVSDEDGVIFISTRKDWIFKTLKPLAADDLQRIESSKRYLDKKLVPLNITQWQPSGKNSQIITLSEADGSKTEQQYLMQSGIVGNSDLNVSILADLESVQRQVLATLLYVGTVYIAVVLLVMVIIARRRIAKQRSQFELRELQALESSEAKVKAIINNTWAGLITLDTKGCIESMNVTAQKLFAYTEDELTGREFYQLLLDVDLQLYLQQIDQQRSSSVETLIAGRVLCGDNRQVPIEFVVGKMRQQGDLNFLITVQDITERKEYEAQLDQSRQLLESRVEQRTLELTNANERLLKEIKQHSQTQNELIQTAKLAVIGQMSAGINHELNQPLMAIRGYADNARKFLKLDKERTVDENLDEIAQLTERMAKILHPLKEFSRKSSGQPQRVPVSALRAGVLAILYPRLEKSKVEVDWPESQQDHFVSGDLLRLEQVMVNLIANAMQAVEAETAPKIVIAQQLTKNRQLLISVRDNGPGIDEEKLTQIFEPFFTTKKEGQGLGLGLSISQRIIEDVGGQLSAKNYNSSDSQSPFGGAEFNVLLNTGSK
ncbi:PAS domain-containing sensor histidine kinase ['Osedax' symbiont bacterium Rs2_46_30_T18]|nr:PAS domain-containing sensor histidine kinase ['Osedax' symbiont bacterium Rs2_46_30_T18]